MYELMQGDCLVEMNKIADGSIDAIVTDPPWMDYETGRYDASEWHHPIMKVSPDKYADKLFRLLKNDGSALLWCRWDVFHEHAESMRSAGFRVRNQIVWSKPNHTAGDLEGNIGNQHECAIFATKGQWSRHNKREVNLWQEPHLFSRDKRYHPTEKPINLMVRSIKLCCPINGVVIDPFMGSGTTGVAALKTGRRFVGIEMDPAYFAIAKRRIADAARAAAGQPKVLTGHPADYAELPMFAPNP